MPKGTNQKLKLYRLAQIMLENTDDEHYITMPEIMEELGKYEVTADRKTIYADLRDLSVLGIEVEGEPIGNRYHYRVVNRPFEAIINALVHRDYSIHTEGMPIQLIMFEDRIEIHNPGGLYGRITIDQLGKIQPDTRNPVLASALETLGITENRYSGIPTIRMEMEKYNLRQPEFLDERGSFIVKLYKESKNDYEDMSNDEETNNLIVFCKTPRTRKEICDYLGLNSVTYAIQTYVNPLVEAGVIKLSIPDKPKSPKQLYYSVEREE